MIINLEAYLCYNGINTNNYGHGIPQTICILFIHRDNMNKTYKFINTSKKTVNISIKQPIITIKSGHRKHV